VQVDYDQIQVIKMTFFYLKEKEVSGKRFLALIFISQFEMID